MKEEYDKFPNKEDIIQLIDGFHGSCLATYNGDTRGIEATLPAPAGVLSSNSDMQHMAVSMRTNQENMKSKTMKRRATDG